MTLEDCVMHEMLPLFGDGSLKYLLSLEGRIDENRLRKAVRLSLDAEPILGCRMVERGGRPVWELRDDLDDMPLCEVFVGLDGGLYPAQFLESPIEVIRDPLVQVIVVRRACDTVCVKMAHAVADATSMKDYVCFLFRIYCRLKDDPGYIPLPNPAGIRSISGVFHDMGFWERLPALRRPGPEPRRGRNRGQWLLPLNEAGVGPHRYRYLFMKLPKEQVRLMREYSRRRKVRITAVLLAAYYLALRTVSRPVNECAVELTTNVDLRRFLPEVAKTTSPGNISAPLYFSLDGHRNSSFDELADALTAQLQKALLDPFATVGKAAVAMGLLARVLGLRVARMLVRAMVRGGGRWLKSRPSVTCLLNNYGALVIEPGDRGDAPICDAQFLGGAEHAGAVKVGVSGFRENMTVTIGFSERFVEEAALRRLLQEFNRALPGYAGVDAGITLIKAGS
jgi:NRPS condensation-like uncharacterized protein